MFWTSDMPQGDNGKRAKAKSRRPESGPIKMPQEKIEKVPTKPGLILLFCGVIVPMFAIGIELSTHMCARMFFDPFPSPSHIVLVALVPLSNFLIWLSARRDMTESLGALTLGSGMAMGVAILYSLMFIPVAPLAMVAVLFFGFGLLPLSPILAIPPIMKSGKYVCYLSKQKKTFYDGEQLKHIGHMIILCTVLAVELPSTLTRLNLNEAANGKKPGEAIEWLRTFGNQEVMLRACYERSGRATDILGSLYEISHPVSIEKVRELFYVITGKPFNSVPLPESMKAVRQEPFHLVKSGLLSVSEAGLGSMVPSFNNAGEESGDEFDLDPDVAGEAVSGVSRGLSVKQQSMRGNIDGQNGFAELDYSINFHNSSKCNREVRTKILLPPGAVISQAFLRTDDGEKEASIMGRSLARSRYRSAVLQKKDPLLVSTCGQDRVLLQLWPVFPEQSVGIRLHILAPMQLSDQSHFQLSYPSFEERNFAVEKPLLVQWVSSTELKEAVNGQAPSFGGNSLASKALTLSISPSELSRHDRVVFSAKDPATTEILAVGKNQTVKVSLSPTRYPRPDYLTMVVDGSIGMKDYMPQILAAMKNLPSVKHLKFYYVRDGLMSEPLVVPSPSPAGLAALIQKVQSLPPAGGQIDLPVVDKALAEIGDDGSGAVLWIHAAQPVPGHFESRNSKRLRELNHPFLYDMEVSAGPNEVLDGISDRPAMVRVPRSGSVENDLSALFSNWKETGREPSTGITFQVAPSTAPEGLTAKDKVWSQLAAASEICKIERDHHGHNCKYAQQAVYLATQYHLVTPFSSALISEPIRIHVRPSAIPLGLNVPRSNTMVSAAPMQNFGSKDQKKFDNGNLLDSLKPKAEVSSFRASGGSFAQASHAEGKLVGADKEAAEESDFSGDAPASPQPIPHNIANSKMDLPSLFAPTVPESDTYLLFGVGMLVLGFAFTKRGSLRKVKA